MKLKLLIKALLLILFFLLYNNAYALYINSDISSMESTQQFYSKSYTNNTTKTNLYNFNVYKIDRPGNNENGNPVENGEIIFTPLKKILLPGEQEFFKIFYRGKEDDKERYYKIIISETPLEMQHDEAKKEEVIILSNRQSRNIFCRKA